MTKPTLVQIPSGYKAGTLYSVVPTSGGDLSFARNSEGTRVNADGLIETKGVNVPRLDYSGGSCPSLLMEPARTNLITYSQEFDNAAWGKVLGGTGVLPIVTPNDTTAPDGTLTADKVVFDTGVGVTSTDRSLLSQAVTVSNATTYSNSIWMRGSVGGEQISYTDSSVTYRTQTLTTEWQRFELSGTTNGTLINYQIGIRQAVDGVINGSATIYIWGAQLEQGSYATSYIPTSGATVTRVADTSSTTGLANLIGDSEGTLYFEGSFIFDDSTLKAISINDGTANNAIDIIQTASNNIQFRSVVGGVVKYNFSSLVNGSTGFKCALRYENNNYAAYINGFKLNSDLTQPTFSDGTLTKISFSRGDGVWMFYGNAKELSLFDVALTDEEITDLTSYDSYAQAADALGYTID